MPFYSLSQNAIHLPGLITDLGLILITASIAVIIFKKLKQPLVLGYLVAGFLAGNNFHFFPTVEKTHDVSIWAEIGVIFLLFSLGLEFSFKKLTKVGGTASITALTQIVCMVLLGYTVGQLMGWTNMDSLFLGVILSISSTTIILKAFEELGVKSQKFAGNVIGSLIVQDILAILMMVLLSTVAVSSQFSGSELIFAILKLIFFLILWFILGIFFIPSFLNKAKHLLTDEMLLIISIALCLLMVIFAASAGFSPGLGAFIMGSIIAETTESEHIEKLIKPVKDLFGAIFFVSVGMLINPQTLVTYYVPVIILTLVTIFGQSISSTIGSLLSGQPLKQSIQAGMSLSQIGEFSFIIATLGLSLKVTQDFLYPVVVAVSAITTFTTPYMIKFSTPFAAFVEDKLPKRWVKQIERYSAYTQAIKPTSLWKSYIFDYTRQVTINTVLAVAIILLSRFYLLPFTEELKLPFSSIITALVTLMFLLPFLWAISLKRINKEAVQSLIQERKYRGAIIIMFIARMLLSVFLIGFMLNKIISPFFGIIMFFLAIFVYITYTKQINQFYYRLEDHFLKNFKENGKESKPKIERQNLTPWDGHIASFVVPCDSVFSGHTIEDLKIRERFGINIAFIKRENKTVYIPSKTELIYPQDELHVIGTDLQVNEFKKYLENHLISTDNSDMEIVLWKLDIKNTSFVNKSIKDSLIREETNGIIVGVEHNGHRMLNPKSSYILHDSDVVWIVGDKNKIKSFIEE
ncbi:sodium:proton antiporter [Flavobacterium sediminis]|uniref:Sodium:proton antiporter n=1 Tax=Flavobacterium sediminis TaxID=2201181 RepID=A0A2U8QSW7_9FLAO|nr:cation:proton antiporter [Flavobacterium sediminis]AWM12986.1 sodium:proton antiporter [Flavobacterium sediminis]